MVIFHYLHFCKFYLFTFLVIGRKCNRWSPVTIRLGKQHKFTDIYNYFVLSDLCIFSRSPTAYHALKSLGIIQLPCDRTLRGYMYKYSSSPGICEDALLERAKKYESYKKEQVEAGNLKPVGEGVFIWDEVKVSITDWEFRLGVKTNSNKITPKVKI